jgi:hypothetical protein
MTNRKENGSSSKYIPLPLRLRVKQRWGVWNHKSRLCRLFKSVSKWWILFFFLVAPTLGSLLLLLEHRAEFPQFLDPGQSVGLLGRAISSSQGLSTCTPQTKAHTQTLNIHALSGIRIHGPGFQASEGSARPRPLGCRDRLNDINS